MLGMLVIEADDNKNFNPPKLDREVKLLENEEKQVCNLHCWEGDVVS